MNFIKTILIPTILMSCVFACKQTTTTPNCNPVTKTAPASEVATLQDYITNSNITNAVKDPRGFFYVIDSTVAGTTKPTICNNVNVDYTGLLTNGNVFDSNTNISFGLSGLITGWQEGIPLVSVGNSIRLYLPPSLAYGASGSGSIPGNSILIFEIKLNKIN
jgi:FKBP-type peptidyl-prolyl cis-trans isomerase FkpA